MEITIKKLNSYHNRALAVAADSPDEQTKVGALLIHSTSGAVIGSGYNGFIRKGPDQDLPKTRPDKYKYIIHAETNLLYNCCRHGIVTEKCFVYCTLSPCVNCLRALYQAGIKEVYFKEKYRDFEENCNMKDLDLNVTPLFDGPVKGLETTDEFYKLIIGPK